MNTLETIQQKKSFHSQISHIICTYVPHTGEVYSAQQQTEIQQWCTERETQDISQFILEIKMRGNRAKPLNETYNKGSPVGYATNDRNISVIANIDAAYDAK